MRLLLVFLGDSVRTEARVLCAGGAQKLEKSRETFELAPQAHHPTALLHPHRAIHAATSPFLVITLARVPLLARLCGLVVEPCMACA